MFRRKSETKSAADLVSEMAAELDKTLPGGVVTATYEGPLGLIMSGGKLMLFHEDATGQMTRLASAPVNVTTATNGSITVTFQVMLS